LQAVALGISDKCIGAGARLFGGCAAEIAQAQRAFGLDGDVLTRCGLVCVLPLEAVHVLHTALG
jgi:hypothetical protein